MVSLKSIAQSANSWSAGFLPAPAPVSTIHHPTNVQPVSQLFTFLPALWLVFFKPPASFSFCHLPVCLPVGQPPACPRIWLSEAPACFPVCCPYAHSSSRAGWPPFSSFYLFLSQQALCLQAPCHLRFLSPHLTSDNHQLSPFFGLVLTRCTSGAS